MMISMMISTFYSVISFDHLYFLLCNCVTESVMSSVIFSIATHAHLMFLDVSRINFTQSIQPRAAA